MADKLKGRRKKESPARKTAEAARAAGVPKHVMAEVLGRRHKSPKALDKAIKKAISDYGGSHAPRLRNQ